MDLSIYIGKDEIKVPHVQANETRRHDPISHCKYVVGVECLVKIMGIQTFWVRIG